MTPLEPSWKFTAFARKSLIACLVGLAFCGGCSKPDREVKGSVFVTTKGGRNIPLGSVEIAFFEEDAIRSLVAAKQVEIDGEALRRGRVLLSAARQVQALKILKALDDEIAALLDVRHFDVERRTRLVEALKKQYDKIAAECQKPETLLSLADVELLHTTIRADLARRVDAQGATLSREYNSSSPSEQATLKSDYEVLTGSKPLVDQVLDQNFDSYASLLKDRTPAQANVTLSVAIQQAHSALRKAHEAVDQIDKVAGQIGFDGLPQPGASVLSGIDGHFQALLRGASKPVIFAKAQRMLPDGSTEEYFWFVRLEAPGGVSGEVNLTNGNMVGAGPAQVFVIPELPSLANNGN